MVVSGVRLTSILLLLSLVRGELWTEPPPSSQPHNQEGPLIRRLNTLATFQWWSLGSPTTQSPAKETTRSMGLATEACQMVGGMTQRQRAVCVESPALVPVMLQGIYKAIRECQKIFFNKRWNCSSFDVNVVFGKKRRPMLPGTKERAIIHALASASVVDVVAQSCYAGNLTSCGMCPVNMLSVGASPAYQWGLCSDNIFESAQFAKRMLDARENSYTPLSAMNLHNNEAGRETIYELGRKACRCHGQSGSCSVKTCWKSFPRFEKVVQRLAFKYDHALLAVVSRKRNHGTFRLAEANQPAKRLVSKNEDLKQLYYIEESPSYCDVDVARGSLGTKGRECTLGGDKWQNCDFLCCGRGYRTEVVEYLRDCNCSFQFCCYVKCDTCAEVKQIHYCL